MKKYDLKKILKYLLIFTLLCILLFYANSLNVKAASVPSSCQFYDNNGSSLSYQLTNIGRDNSGNISYYSTENSFTLTAGSYGGLVVCSLDTPVLKDKLYTLSVNFDLPGAVSTLSRKSILGLGANDNYARNNYINSTGVDIKSASSNNSVLSYVFVPKVNANYIAIPFGSTTTVSTTPYLRNLTISYQGDTNQLTSEEIQTIINNSNSQISQSIIDNQNKNNEELKDTIDSSLNNCRDSYNLFNPSGGNLINGKGISSNGSIIDDPTGSYYDYYIPVSPSTTYNLSNKDDVQFAGSWFFAYYDNNKNFISLNRLGESSTNFTFTTTSNVSYVRLYSYLNLANVNSLNNIMLSKGSSKIKFENYGKVCTSKLDDTNKNLNDLKDDINNSDSSGATGDADNFFSNFQTDTFGLTSIITAPLNLISSLTSKTCSNLVLPLPYVNKNLTLPCLSTIYSQFFGDFLTIYQTITFGIVAYWVCVRIFNLVKDFKNPDHDEIEVMDL